MRFLMQGGKVSGLHATLLYWRPGLLRARWGPAGLLLLVDLLQRTRTPPKSVADWRCAAPGADCEAGLPRIESVCDRTRKPHRTALVIEADARIRRSFRVRRFCGTRCST